MAKKTNKDEQRIFKAMTHPLRVQALTLLNQRVASPSDIAEELGAPLNLISYHVRMLLDLGCIELVETAQRRGAIEHYYRATVRPFLSEDSWAALPPSLRQSLTSGIAGEVARDLATAADQGALDRDTAHVTRTSLMVDEAGAAELRKLLDETLERAHQIQAASAKRGGGGGAEAKLILMLLQGA